MTEDVRVRRSMRRHTLSTVAVVALLVGGVGGWTATTHISGAVTAPGMVVVDSNVKKVQHPTGGVVGELMVREGDRVEADAVLVRLDATIARSNLAIVVKSLDELAARQSRLEAERDNKDEVSFPDSLTSRAANPDVGVVMKGEQNLFELRRAARAGQKGQLNERAAQLEDEIKGLTEQVQSKTREIELILQELQGVRELWEKKLVQISRLIQLERETVRLTGERGQLVANVAQAKGKIAEIKLQVIQIDQDLRSDVAKDLREIQGKTAELMERKTTAEDQLMRIDIRSPQRGFVHQLAVHTVGGVVSPGEPLMYIVPEADILSIEVRLPPQNIDQVALGQNAIVRFSAFNQRTTPELTGLVTKVSADITQDPKTGAAFYTLRIALSDDEIARLQGLKLIPGMPVDAFVQSGDRSVLSYLVKPVQDQIVKAFRER